MTATDTQTADARRATLVAALTMSADGDRQAFRRVYDLTAAKLYGICLRICGERQAAEDVLQEVYLIVWRRAAAYRPERSHPVTWLATIARNRALDWRRSPRGRAFAPIPTDDAHESADDALPADQAMVAIEDGQRLDLCLEELDERPRHAIRSAFLDGLTYADVAGRVGVPLPTMKSIIRRALIRLRECLNDDA